MSYKYTLKGKKAVPIDDVLEWGNWMETADRIVKQDYLSDGKLVSTVFLGLDHNFGGGKPLIFETMVFSEKEKTLKMGKTKTSYHPEKDQERYSTWKEAEAGHKEMVKKWNDKANRKKR